MKKLTLTLALVLGMTLGALAQKSSSTTLSQNPYEVDDSESFFEYLQQMFIMEEDLEDPYAAEYEGLSNDGGMFGGGGLFQRGAGNDYTMFGGNRNGNLLGLPSVHGAEGDADVPLGGGIALLIGLGGAYLVAKKRKGE